MACRTGSLWGTGGTRRQPGGGGAEDFLVEVVEVRNQFQPEGNLICSIVVPDARLQADVEILLVFRVELGPDHFLKAVGLGVDELGVLRNRQVGIPRDNRYLSSKGYFNELHTNDVGHSELSCECFLNS